MYTLILNKSELGAGTRGSALGVDAIRYASLENDKDFFQNAFELNDFNDCLWENFDQDDYPNAHFINELTRFYAMNTKRVSQLINTISPSIFLSGDHSSTALYLGALKSLAPESKIGVVWIDAHSDLHSPYTSPSGNMHGMTLANSLGLDNLENKRNDVNSRTKKYWNELKNISGFSPIILPQDLVFIGLRDIEKEESAIINHNNIKSYYSEEIINKDLRIIGQDILEYLSACDKIFISFDVDSMDPDEVSKGTGTPVAGGLNFNQTMDLIDILTQDKRVNSFEITEVNPLLDKKNKMAKAGFKILQKVAQNFSNHQNK